MSRNARVAYLEAKARLVGLEIFCMPHRINLDVEVYAVTNGKRTANISISGLELLQNTLTQMEWLLDARFDEAAKMLHDQPAEPQLASNNARNQSQAQAVGIGGLGSALPFGWIATPLHQETALLRERITGLEIENARLNRELLAARMPVIHAVDIVQAKPDTDRIWDALRLAATS
jgi:hypothetical protein